MSRTRSKWSCCPCCLIAHTAHESACLVHQAPVMTDGDVCRCTCGAWAFWGEPCWYCGTEQPPKPPHEHTPERNPR